MLVILFLSEKGLQSFFRAHLDPPRMTTPTHSRRSRGAQGLIEELLAYQLAQGLVLVGLNIEIQSHSHL
jgi:hypothetical protein